MWKKILPTAIAILVLAPVVRADHGRGPRPGDPSLWAHRLEVATQDVRLTAESRLRPFVPREREALRRLERLNRLARRLHRDLERFGPDPYRLEDDLDRLFRAFETAAYHVDHVRSGAVRRDFARVDRIMERLPRSLRFAQRRHGSVDRLPSRSHGSVIVGDDHGRTRYRLRFDW